MKDKIINTLITDCNDPRTLYLYLYFTKGKDLKYISDKLLKMGNLRYIHFLLRTFELDNYKVFIDYILKENNSAGYLFNILYDVDYLDDNTRINIINEIIELKDNRYIIKACYYYFNVLNKFNDLLFKKIQYLIKTVLNIDINKDNYLKILETIIYKDDYIEEKEGFSSNCYQGRNGYIPSIIVCHINNTYGSAINRFYDESSEVSAHYVIRRDGHIKQVVSLDDSAWANGTSIREESDIYYEFSTSPLINTIKDNANYYTFSIEHESFDGNLTEEQFNSTIKVMKEIIKYLKDKYNYDFIIDRDHIIGHNEVNPIVRKKCPGKYFPFDRIIKELKK